MAPYQFFGISPMLGVQFMEISYFCFWFMKMKVIKCGSPGQIWFIPVRKKKKKSFLMLTGSVS